jgi:peptidyl-prolyl cis-trans isomerase SurA
MKLLRVISALALVGATEVHAEPKLTDALEAVVHDSVISSYQVEMNAAPALRELARQYPNDRETFMKKREEVADESRDHLVEIQLILHEFDTAGYSMPESVIEDYVDARVREIYHDRATATKSLQADGMTFERFRKQTRERFIYQQMGYKNVSDIVVVSPHKIEVYYAAHTNDFFVEDQVKLRMLVLNKSATDQATDVRQRADDLLAKIRAGGSFADLAKENSQDSRASAGGDWGWFETSKLRKELADAASTLKTGTCSDVIETPEACYLILVEERRAAHVKGLNEVHSEIETILLDQEHTRLRQQWIERLKKKTFIRYF